MHIVCHRLDLAIQNVSMSSIFTISATFGWNIQGYALHLDDSDHSDTDDVNENSAQTLASSGAASTTSPTTTAGSGDGAAAQPKPDCRDV